MRLDPGSARALACSNRRPRRFRLDAMPQVGESALCRRVFGEGAGHCTRGRARSPFPSDALPLGKCARISPTGKTSARAGDAIVPKLRPVKPSPALFAALFFAAPLFAAETPKPLPAADARLGPLKDLDGYFPFTPPESREAWAKRADEVRMQLRVALGIWPEPTRTPMNAVIHGRIEREDHTVEKVYFEAMPGFFVTGTLYRPRTPGPHPAVLCPHGHWEDARWAVRGEAEMKKELASGGERLAEGGRSIFQSLGVQLARMGVVAFNFDMLGYCDSQQISLAVAHKFAKQRPEMNAADGWGFFSPRAEANAQSVMGLQTWNAIRALDFLETLPDVDAKRLGCTGASGGGTQTFILGALDPRLAVACPAVMVSTAMQGGCTCENASLLRVGTGNVEIAALFAPKPLGMTAANDWTKEMETKGFPELQKHYALMGAPQNVALWPMLQFGHNYNAPSREKIYAWFNEHFRLGLPADRLIEREYPLLTREQMTVWDDAHPAPPGGVEFEKRLLRWWRDDAHAQLAKAPEDFEKIARPAWRTLVGKVDGAVEMLGASPRVERTAHGEFLQMTGVLRNPQGALIPAILLQPEKLTGGTVLWLGKQAKAALFNADDTPRENVARLLDAGCIVLAIDLFRNDEFANRPVTNPREAPAYTYGYNRTLLAQRVHDTLDALRFARASEPKAMLMVCATEDSGPLAAVALAAEPGAADAAVIETGGFRFERLRDWLDFYFLPAAAKYGDIPGALALSAPRPLYLIGESAPAFAEATYRRAGAEKKLTLAPKDAPLSAAVDWLLQQTGKKP